MKYNFRIDQKYTGWKQFHYSVEAESEENAIEIMKEEFQRMVLDDEIFVESEPNYDSEEDMLPEYNNGNSTRELYFTNDDRKPIAINGEFYHDEFDKEHYLEVEY